jgi:regulator of protease activity HflC (stomatin/prohibitin superfamily)
MSILPLGTIRPTERGIVERFGKFNAFKEPGLVLLIPLVDNLNKVNITEQMVDAKQQEVITKDNLNAKVDAQIYFKVKEDETSVKKSEYAVDNYYVQIVALCRTTLRDIIGNMSLTDANSKRNEINKKLALELSSQTEKWGIEVVRAELKEIQPPADVQDQMNKVVVAQNRKVAAVDNATATETEADGKRRAAIKEAEGIRQASIIEAEGEAQAMTTIAEAKAKQIQLVNVAAQKYFKGNAKDLRKLEVAENSLKENSKIIVSKDGNLVNVIGDSMGVTPLMKNKAK